MRGQKREARLTRRSPAHPSSLKRMGCRVKPQKTRFALLPGNDDPSTIDALDPCDDGLGAQLGDNSAEMLEVIDLEVDGELGEIRRAARHTDIVDIAVMLGDHGRDLRETARLVDVVDPDARRESLRRGLVHVPTYVEPALRLFLKILQIRRLDRIDRNPL